MAGHRNSPGHGERPAGTARKGGGREPLPRVVVHARHTAMGEALCHVLEGAGYHARHLGTRSLGVTASDILRASPDVFVAVVGAEADHHHLDQMTLIVDLADAGVPVVGLTGHRDDLDARRLLRRAGAVVIVGSGDSLSRFVAAIRAVHDGTSQPGHESGAQLADERTRDDYVSRLQSLSARERVILEDLQRGRTVSEIARRDVVAQSTVRAQVASILRKLGVSSQLAAVAILHWTFDPPPSVDQRG